MSLTQQWLKHTE